MQTTPLPREHVSTYLEPALRDRLAELARENERSVAAEVRLVLREHLTARTEPASEPRATAAS